VLFSSANYVNTLQFSFLKITFYCNLSQRENLNQEQIAKGEIKLTVSKTAFQHRAWLPYRDWLCPVTSGARVQQNYKYSILETINVSKHLKLF